MPPSSTMMKSMRPVMTRLARSFANLHRSMLSVPPSPARPVVKRSEAEGLVDTLLLKTAAPVELSL